METQMGLPSFSCHSDVAGRWTCDQRQPVATGTEFCNRPAAGHYRRLSDSFQPHVERATAMNFRRDYSAKFTNRQEAKRSAFVGGRGWQRRPKQARRTIGGRNARIPFTPPEDWYEPTDADEYRVVIQPPGAEYAHVVTEQEIRGRLAEVPEQFIRELEVVQLSQMTRKKQSFPCYGMQWGNAIYLYPLEETLVEQYYEPPRPNLWNEARMYGGRWSEPAPGVWNLTWTEKAAKDFYLNNILIHELGHLVDERNTTYQDRERFAEWFAIHYGYRFSGGDAARRPRRTIRKRHHAK
jgi:hypothetical protein